jgi:hypothetical protein
MQVVCAFETSVILPRIYLITTERITMYFSVNKIIKQLSDATERITYYLFKR